MADGHPVQIEYETVAGVIVRVTPLSIYTIQALKVKAADEFPYPDKTIYQVESELMASGFIPAEENKDYIDACQQLDLQRSKWRIRQTIELACEYPGFNSRDAMIANYRPALEKLRRVIALDEDEWQAVLNHCVFTGRDDINNVFFIAGQDEKLMLTGGEVIDGIRLFFLDVSKSTRRALVG